MKPLINFILLTVVFISACQCPECFTPPEPLRIIFEDVDGNDFLINSTVEVDMIKFCDSSDSISFDLSNLTEAGILINTGIEIDREMIWDNCETKDCCIIVDFSDESSDTLTYRITEESDKCCIWFTTSKIEFNGVDILNTKDSNQVGAFVATK